MNPDQTPDNDQSASHNKDALEQLDRLPPNPLGSDNDLTLFHAPNTRSAGIRILLEELGISYHLHVINMKANGQRSPEYLAINPMGKVPALLHRGVLVTEQAAISIYLADMFPQAGLAPSTSDVMRGSYLRWMVFYGSCFEPALIDRAMKREPGPTSSMPYGDVDTAIATIFDHLEKGPYILGDRMTAVDVLWGTALQWVTMFKLVTATPAVQAYIDRMTSRPSFAKIRAEDAALSAQHAQAIATAGDGAAGAASS